MCMCNTLVFLFSFLTSLTAASFVFHLLSSEILTSRSLPFSLSSNLIFAGSGPYFSVHF